jgi:hypothetical protein
MYLITIILSSVRVFTETVPTVAEDKDIVHQYNSKRGLDFGELK